MKTLSLAFLLFTSLAFSQNQGPDTVSVGAYVISVHDINFHDKEYTARFWLWFLYTNPEFDFTTQLDIPNAKTIDAPESIVDTVNGKTWVMLKMKTVMKKNWSVQDFPFDRQHLRIEIENSILDQNNLIFKPDVKGSKFDFEEAIDGWTIENFTVGVRSNSYETGFGDPRPGHDHQTFSQFTVELDIERNAWGLFMKIFLGMYIAFLISIISFTPHPSARSKEISFRVINGCSLQLRRISPNKYYCRVLRKSRNWRCIVTKLGTDGRVVFILIWS